MIKAWRLDRDLRVNAVPVDRRVIDRNYLENVNDEHLINNLFLALWNTQVPGSGAPEVAYVSMVAAMEAKGYDVRRAEQALEEALALRDRCAFDELTPKTHELLRLTYASPLDPASPYHAYEHPQAWEDVRKAMHPGVDDRRAGLDLESLQAKIYAGWLGQLAGGSFGTAIEGYTGEQITKVYGKITDYVTKPETTNDDAVYELVFLDVFERMGRGITSQELGREWVRQIPFGWSAELVALENMKKGILPPESGRHENAYSDWLGVQMRSMICGMVAPAWPMEAARLAHVDGVISHSANGVYGGIYAAVATSLAFCESDPRRILEKSLQYIPQQSEYAAVVRFCLDVVREHNPQAAWKILDEKYQRYNWIHAYPNIAADILALWHCSGDLTEAFSLLALAGLDVDCNAGLVGNVLGILHGVPPRWADPIQKDDLLETYLPATPRLSIRALAERTYQAALSIL